VNAQFFRNLNLVDSYLRQRFDIGSFGGNVEYKLKITLRIIEVYKGDQYLDTAVSENNFDGLGDH
jgi:hypothetical protein